MQSRNLDMGLEGPGSFFHGQGAHQWLSPQCVSLHESQSSLAILILEKIDYQYWHGTICQGKQVQSGLGLG